MAANSILLYKVEFDLVYSMDEIVYLIEKDILDETRVVVEHYDNDSLSGIYVYTEIYKTREYDFESNNFEIITRKKHIVTEFHINIKDKYMDIWGTAKNAQKVITVISLAFDNRIIIEPYEINSARMIEYLSKEENVYVEKITARQVVLNDGLLADCTFDLSHNDNPFNVINRYKNNIRKISLKWRCKDTTIPMLIYMSGALIVYKARYMIQEEELECIYRMLLYAGRK